MKYFLKSITHTTSSGDISPTSVVSKTLDHSLRNETARRRHADLSETVPVKTLKPLQKPFQMSQS